MARARRNSQKRRTRIPKQKTIHFLTTTTHSNGHKTVDHVVRYTSFKVIASHATIISSGGQEVLAPSATQPGEYPRNPPSAQKMPVHLPEVTESCNSIAEGTKSVKPAEAGERMKGAQCKGWRPPFQKSGQENRAVGKNIHAKSMEEGLTKKRDMNTRRSCA